MFYCILRYSFARICFSKRLTSSCIRLSFISCSLASNYLRFLSVNLRVSNAVFSMVLGKGSLLEMGSCYWIASIACDSLANDCFSLLGGYCETTALKFSFHSGLSRTVDFTSLMASSRFWLQYCILYGSFFLLLRNSLVVDERFSDWLRTVLETIYWFFLSINFIIV